MRLIYKNIEINKDGASYSYNDPSLDNRDDIINLSRDKVDALEKSVNDPYSFTRSKKGKYTVHGVNKSIYKADSGITHLSKKEKIRAPGSYYEFDVESADKLLQSKEGEDA